MLISNYNTFFFHVPKTAGYTIEHYLLPGNRNCYVFDPAIIYGIYKGNTSQLRGSMSQHFTYKEILNLSGREFLNSKFKFAFFRNTWERFASAFFYLEEMHLKLYNNFDIFVEKICEQVFNYKHTNGWHFAKQTDWLYDDTKNICLDYIGRYENLNEDFEKICNQIGCEFTKLSRKNQTRLSKENINYRDLYNDKTKNLIKDAYQEEIDFFDFKF